MNNVSLIVPFYNEQEILHLTVPRILAYMRKHFKKYEVIFVDDGSTDGSLPSVNKLCHTFQKGSRVSVIGYPKNAGRGKAIRFGMERAVGMVIGYIDCDLELKLEYIGRAVKLLSSHDIVIASKFAQGSVVRTPIIRGVSSKIYNLVTRIILGSRVRDHQAGLKFFRREVISELLSLTKENGWVWDTEMLYIAQKKSRSIYEMPITISYGFRKMRSSFFIDFLKLFGIIIKLKYSLDKRISALYNTTI